MNLFLEMVGIVTICVLAMALGIPIIVGAVQFWIYFVSLIRKDRKKKDEPPAAA